LKRIADPENLESDNPAIKKAAEIKKEEDLKKQKIKAIKYLATVGCGCYPGVREALLAALDDCTEEVRLEAAVAFCEAAGNHCNRCENGCCNAEVMQKLHEMAYGQDEKGCMIESSAEVRAAAANALNACSLKHPPGPAAQTPIQPVPETPKEVPVEPSPPPVETPAPPVEAPKPAVETPPPPVEAPKPVVDAPKPVDEAPKLPVTPQASVMLVDPTASLLERVHRIREAEVVNPVEAKPEGHESEAPGLVVVSEGSRRSSAKTATGSQTPPSPTTSSARVISGDGVNRTVAKTRLVFP
jgi:outer membrane biosynthesis protein TonB